MSRFRYDAVGEGWKDTGKSSFASGGEEAYTVEVRFAGRRGDGDLYDITWSVTAGGSTRSGSKTVTYTGKPVSVNVAGGGAITVQPPAD